MDSLHQMDDMPRQERILSAKRMICSAKEGFKKVPGGRRIRSGEFLGAFGILLTSSGLLCSEYNVENIIKNALAYVLCAFGILLTSSGLLCAEHNVEHLKQMFLHIFWVQFDKFWATARRT